MKKLFDTRSHSWREVGLARQLSARAVKRARIQTLVLLPLIAGVLVLYSYRRQHLRRRQPVRIATVFALVALGWQFARDLGRAAGPTLFRRLDPGTAGTVGFLIRFFTIVAAVIVALRIAGLDPRTLAVGGAFTAVVLGLAAQQTLGNLFAGLVLLSARPFRVGDRVRLQGGGLAGDDRGRRQLARAALHDLRRRRGPDHGPQQRRAERRGHPAARARPASTCARGCAPGVTPGDIQTLLRGDRRDADARHAARRAGGDRRRRGRRPHRRVAREPARWRAAVHRGRCARWPPRRGEPRRRDRRRPAARRRDGV